MFQSIILILSPIAFTLSIIAAIMINKKERGSPKKVIAALMIGTSAALFFIYVNGNVLARGGPIDTVITSILGVIRSMTGENSVGDTREMAGQIPSTLEYIFSIYTAVLHLFISALLLGFILSFFRNFFPWLRYRFLSTGKLCIFSEVSLRSILLATDMRDREKRLSLPRSTIVFLGNRSDESSEAIANISRVDAIDAFLFDKSVGELPLYKRYLKKQIDFFLLKFNESENLRDALEISAKYGKTKMAGHIQIYTLNGESEAEAIIDSIEYSSVLSLRLIRENRTKLQHLLDIRPLFLAKRGNKIPVLIAGLGRCGTEAAKLVSWAAQTIDLQPEIIIVDKDPEAINRFNKQCPELAPDFTPAEGSKDCDIHFICADIESADFREKLAAFPDVSYVICVVGDENLNLRCGMTIRSIYEEIRFDRDGEISPPPSINVMLGDPFLYEISGRVKFDNRVNCDLLPFGSLKETYSYDNLISPYLDKAGIAVNRFYTREYAKTDIEAATGEARNKLIAKINKEADMSYEDKEYNRSSSTALGLHCKYKIFSVLCELQNNDPKNYDWTVPPSNDMLNEVEKALLNEKTGRQVVEELAIAEHKRWNAFMRSEGWRSASPEICDKWYKALNGHRNFAAKLHACIVPYERLPELDRWVFERYEKTVNFAELDRVMVRAVAEILTEAQKIYKNQ